MREVITIKYLLVWRRHWSNKKKHRLSYLRGSPRGPKAQTVVRYGHFDTNLHPRSFACRTIRWLVNGGWHIDDIIRTIAEFNLNVKKIILSISIMLYIYQKIKQQIIISFLQNLQYLIPKPLKIERKLNYFYLNFLFRTKNV